MFEKAKKIRLDVTLAAVLTVLIGVVLLIYPAQTSNLLARLLAITLIIIGIVQLVGALSNVGHRTLGVIVAGILVCLGGYLFYNPSIVVKIIPIIFGILLVVHGVKDIGLAFDGRGFHARHWAVAIVAGIISIALGLFCIANAFGIVTVAMRIFGIMLIYDGISDMFIVHRVNSAAREVEGTILHEEDVVDEPKSEE